jgi:hypothetical protein
MPKASGMVRTTVMLRKDQVEALRVEQERTGAPPAEQIRRAIDAALGTKPVRKGGKCGRALPPSKQSLLLGRLL